MVAYTRQTSALYCTTDTLLDAASYDQRWVLLYPASAPAAGVDRAADTSPIGSQTAARDPGPDFQVGWWLVTAGPWQDLEGQGLARPAVASFSTAGSQRP